MNPRRRTWSRRVRAAVAIAAIGAIGAAAGTWFVFGVPAALTGGAEVRLFIRKGAPFVEAADSLAAHGVISSPRNFARYARLRGRDRSLRWGTYILRKEMGWERVLESLNAGRGVVHTVTIPEGLMLTEIAPIIAEALDVSPDSVIAAAGDTALLNRLAVPTPTLEGYLFPDTYSFPDRSSAREAVRTMVERFEAQWKPEWDSILPSAKLTRHEVVTLASIIEREVRWNEERPIIAAVYLNRLRIRMPLQADPTINYALGRRPGRVLFRDLRVDSPYNTYRNPGLPPGPIGSPGAASIEAALNPANVPYRYFVAAPDGHHEFRRTYAEHLAAIDMVREAARRDSAEARKAAAKSDSAGTKKAEIDGRSRPDTP